MDDLQHFANQAFVQLIVNVLGCGVLFCFYYNYRVLEAYFLALFWATICSIPMFQLKTWLIQTLVAIFLGEKKSRLSTLNTQPYVGLTDFLFRDVPWMARVTARFVLWWWRPMQEMFLGDTHLNHNLHASRPFFGILTRCGVLTFSLKLYKRDIIGRYIVVTIGLCVVYYVGLVSVRLYYETVIVRSAPEGLDFAPGICILLRDLDFWTPCDRGHVSSIFPSRRNFCRSM